MVELSQERETVPPGGDPMDNPAHQAIVRRLENGISKRFDDSEARLAALETLGRTQADRIEALEAAVRSGNRETKEGQERILQAFERYTTNVVECVTRLEQVSRRVETLEHEHAINHRLSGAPQG